MKIFRATDIRINAIPIIADDVHHASHTLLFAMHEGLQHWPGVSYAIGPWEPPHDMRPGILNGFADQHMGGIAELNDGGWRIIPFDRHRTFS